MVQKTSSAILYAAKRADKPETLLPPSTTARHGGVGGDSPSPVTRYEQRSEDDNSGGDLNPTKPRTQVVLCGFFPGDQSPARSVSSPYRPL
ncbi:hypothetical protein MRB53_022968 [Persea americana]|uniref:Uncharacterized protein n=1 Tax=Persea americana TaxID=3435 RepID=A0ACC2L8P5_PERAE|nr:hypothetical protein MRB53_022968 [Persea americana]